MRKRRPAFSEEERERILSVMREAKSQGLQLNVVARELAEELDSNENSVYNVYNRVRKAEESSAEETSHEVVKSACEEALVVKLLLEKVEQLTSERDEWKHKYHKKEEEFSAFKDSVLEKLLS